MDTNSAHSSSAHSECQQIMKRHDKIYDCIFPIANFPLINSKIQPAPIYGVRKHSKLLVVRANKHS